MTIERRSIESEITASEDGRSFSGYAAVFGQRTYVGPEKRGFFEELAPTAFDKVLAGRPDVAFAFNHNPDHLLARTSSGTLKLSVDGTGLRTEAHLPDTTLGRDVAELLRRGDLRGQSYQYVVAKGGDRWENLPGGHSQLRTIENVATLIDVGPVTFPQYDGTTASVRSALLTAPAEVRSAVLAIAESRAAGDVAGLLELVDTAVDALCAMCMAADGAVEALMAAMGMPDMDDGDMPQANSASGRSVHQLKARLRLAQLAQGGR